jgi:hypothetical protein
MNNASTAYQEAVSSLDLLVAAIQGTGAQATSATITAELSRLDRRMRRTVASDTPTVFAIARPERPLEAISSTRRERVSR